MVKQEDFKVERWMDEFEDDAKFNIAETCCYSLSLNEVAEITGSPIPFDKLAKQRLTYGAIPGSKELRENIATIVNDPKGPVRVGAEDIIVTNGAIGANFLVYYALLGPGDHAIVIDPAYQQLQSVPAMFGAEVELLELKPENKYLPDLEELKSKIKPNTKLININSPHNPSGAVIPDAQLEQIVEIARQADCFLLADEVYRPLYHSTDVAHSVATLYEKGIITSSTSKAFGLAGLRLGWVASPSKEVITECAKRRDYNTISVSLVDDIIATWALSNYKRILDYNFKLCRANLQILDDFVSSTEGASYVKPTGGTVAFVQLRDIPDTEKFASELIAQTGVLVVPGETFNKPGFLRIGYGNSTEELRAGLELIKEFMTSHGKH